MMFRFRLLTGPVRQALSYIGECTNSIPQRTSKNTKLPSLQTKKNFQMFPDASKSINAAHPFQVVQAYGRLHASKTKWITEVGGWRWCQAQGSQESIFVYGFFMFFLGLFFFERCFVFFVQWFLCDFPHFLVRFSMFLILYGFLRFCRVFFLRFSRVALRFSIVYSS